MSVSTLTSDAATANPSRWRERLTVAFAVVASAGLLWLASGQVVTALAYALGVGCLAIVLAIATRPREAAEVTDFAPPDWSVTHAAIERGAEATAIIDRAGRLTCANARFAECFGIGSAPPRLGLEGVDNEALESAARAAWRDGRAEYEAIAAGGREWRLEIERAGRGQDFLIWRFAPVVRRDPLQDVIGHVRGKVGQALGREGIQIAVVAPDGLIHAANTLFAARAVGEADADVAGTDFVGYFSADEQERIFYAREGNRGASVRMLHVPIADPEAVAASSAAADPAQTASLFLLIDNQGGVGDTRTGIPQIEALLARLPLGLAMTDRDGRFLFANKAFLRAAGHDESGPPPYPSDLVIREDKGALADAVRRFAGGGGAGDVAVRLRSAPEDPVSLSLAGVRGLGEGAVILSLKDSSEETRLKREIAQATKMQAVGQLAGGVAHDFNNVLTAIIGYCDLMLMRHTPGDSDYDDIQQIRANSNRAASLTRQLLAFSRQQTLRPEVLQLPDVVAEISTLLKRLLGEKILLEVTHDRGLGLVRADPVQLEQVLLNLAVNARDAMTGNGGSGGIPATKGGGVLRLKTKRVTAADVRAMKSEILPIGDYTALIVEDTGHGIPPAQIGKIFEPFFTTKEKGKGTGLGLSTVYGIVKQSGGFIFAESEVGKGTRFSIYFPVHVPDAADAEEAAQAASAAKLPPKRKQWSGGGRVLLVEDEDTVRAVAERALVRQGYEVTTASDGEDGLEALGRAISAGEEFDLVVSDVVMPSMDGPAMAREIRNLRPELPVLFMSGYAEEQLRREIDIPNMYFLAKPFSVAQICTAVEDVLKAR